MGSASLPASGRCVSHSWPLLHRLLLVKCHQLVHVSLQRSGGNMTSLSLMSPTPRCPSQLVTSVFSPCGSCTVVGNQPCFLQLGAVSEPPAVHACSVCLCVVTLSICVYSVTGFSDMAPLHTRLVVYHHMIQTHLSPLHLHD